MERYHATSVLSLTARLGRAVELINAGIGRMSALGANRTRRDGGNDVSDPLRTSRGGFHRPARIYEYRLSLKRAAASSATSAVMCHPQERRHWSRRSHPRRNPPLPVQADRSMSLSPRLLKLPTPENCQFKPTVPMKAAPVI